jgi:hypothetical protein
LALASPRGLFCTPERSIRHDCLEDEDTFGGTHLPTISLAIVYETEEANHEKSSLGYIILVAIRWVFFHDCLRFCGVSIIPVVAAKGLLKVYFCDITQPYIKYLYVLADVAITTILQWTISWNSAMTGVKVKITIKELKHLVSQTYWVVLSAFEPKSR